MIEFYIEKESFVTFLHFICLLLQYLYSKPFNPLRINSEILEKSIRKNIKNPDLCVDFILDKLGVSYSTLYRFCMKEYLQTPKQKINKMRISAIVHEVDNCKKHIYDVAEDFGITNRCTFYNLTMKYYGICPTQIESSYL